MKKKKWHEYLDNLDPELVKKLVEQNKKRVRGIWLRVGAIVLSVALLIGSVFLIQLIKPSIPIVNAQTPSDAPKYYGYEWTVGGLGGGANPNGISVTAKLIETLPDTYTFFGDWRQIEFRLLRMQTVKLLKGKEMTDEFYYLIPVGYMTELSAFDRFVIKDMAQFTYEHSVMYNKTQGKAEQLNTVIFGYRVYGYSLMGENFMPFDSFGIFDDALWNSNDKWKEDTKLAFRPSSLAQAEKSILDEEWERDLYVHLLKDISGEAAEALAQLRSFDDGIFVQDFSTSVHRRSPEVQFSATRYINGFATNERVDIRSKEWNGGDRDILTYTKARFSEDDMSCLPDLTSAFEAVKGAVLNGSVTPPNYKAQEPILYTSSGIFGWYAKTEKGVIGIVRVTWRFSTETYDDCYDDAYYIIEYGSEECKPVSRDSLLEILGDHETSYIYTGEYDRYGKYIDRENIVIVD